MEFEQFCHGIRTIGLELRNQKTAPVINDQPVLVTNTND